MMYKEVRQNYEFWIYKIERWIIEVFKNPDQIKGDGFTEIYFNFIAQQLENFVVYIKEEIADLEIAQSNWNKIIIGKKFDSEFAENLLINRSVAIEGICKKINDLLPEVILAFTTGKRGVTWSLKRLEASKDYSNYSFELIKLAFSYTKEESLSVLLVPAILSQPKLRRKVLFYLEKKQYFKPGDIINLPKKIN